MRVVVDSSVIIAGIARPGVCTQLLDEVSECHSWVSSRFILDEVARKLREKFGIPAGVIKEMIADIERVCQRVEPSIIPVASCRDPNDLLVLGTALSGQADLIVSVDKDLLVLAAFRGIPIVKPGEGFRRLRR